MSEEEMLNQERNNILVQIRNQMGLFSKHPQDFFPVDVGKIFKYNEAMDKSLDILSDFDDIFVEMFTQLSEVDAISIADEQAEELRQLFTQISENISNSLEFEEVKEKIKEIELIFDDTNVSGVLEEFVQSIEEADERVAQIQEAREGQGEGKGKKFGKNLLSSVMSPLAGLPQQFIGSFMAPIMETFEPLMDYAEMAGTFVQQYLQPAMVNLIKWIGGQRAEKDEKKYKKAQEKYGDFTQEELLAKQEHYQQAMLESGSFMRPKIQEELELVQVALNNFNTDLADFQFLQGQDVSSMFDHANESLENMLETLGQKIADGADPKDAVGDLKKEFDEWAKDVQENGANAVNGIDLDWDTWKTEMITALETGMDANTLGQKVADKITTALENADWSQAAPSSASMASFGETFTDRVADALEDGDAGDIPVVLMEKIKTGIQNTIT